MRVIWTQAAADDLEAIVEYIYRSSPDAAARVAAHIFDTIVMLASFPQRGKKRDEDDSREIVFVPWPYVAVYQIVHDGLIVEAIRHTSRDRVH